MATMNYTASKNRTVHSPPPYPKIISLLGADTHLGFLILVDLLSSPQVDKVYAIVFQDIAIHSLPISLKRKIRLTITEPENFGKSLSRITECDIAFCISSTDRHALLNSAMSKESFEFINYDAPVRFINCHFQKLGCLNMTILSHINADSNSNAAFYKLKAQLENFIQNIIKDALDFSPVVSLFKLPSYVMADVQVDDNVAEIPLQDISAAMVIDAFHKVRFKGPPGTDSKKSSRQDWFEIFDMKAVSRFLKRVDYGGQESWVSPF